MLAGVATLLGIDATADGSTIVMHSMRQVHRLAATWELLLDPATLLFFVGGATMLAYGAAVPATATDVGEIACRLRRRTTIGESWITGLRTLTLVVVLWLPVRAGLLMALYLHRVLRSDPDRPLARDEPFLFAVDAAVVVDRAGAAGLAIRARSETTSCRRVHAARR